MNKYKNVIISIHFNWYVRETIKANNRNAKQRKTEAGIKQPDIFCFVLCNAQPKCMPFK